MKRNVKKAIERGKEYTRKRPGLDLCVAEFADLLTAFKDRREESGVMEAAFSLTCEAYLMGLDVGMRNARKRKHRSNKG